jgi:hypothetical protein
VDVVQPALQVQFLNVRVREAYFVESGQTVGRDLLEVLREIGKRLSIEEGNEISRSWIELHRIEQIRRR